MTGMDEYIVKDGKKLRLGYTTGSCAAAAAKAAAWMLLTGQRKETIQLDTPKGIVLSLSVREIRREQDAVSCAIEKDGGDDTDVTSGSLIFARVSRKKEPGISIDGGIGVGRVTKRGLDQSPGEAAINSVPRQMIRENLEELCRVLDEPCGLSVLISVPDGEMLAKKTFNPRLGIEGGISILGTSGIVEPMSEQALLDTVRIELRQRREQGDAYVLLTPGNYGMDYLKKETGISPELPVVVSNFIGESLLICKELGFRGVLLVGHIGKLVKIAGGLFNTHSRYGDCRMEILAAYAAAEGLCAYKTAQILEAAACDEAVRILKEEKLFEQTRDRLVKRIDFLLEQKVFGEMETGAILFSKEYGLLGETERAQSLLKRITEE